MYYLEYCVLPGANNPRREQLGEGLVCCWIDRPSLTEADRVAQRIIRREHWDVLERQCGEVATEADHAGDEEWLGYYRQALTDKEVFAFHLSPRHPVYWLTASVARESPAEAAEAHYFLSGASILQEGEDLYDPGFWSAELERVAEAGATEAITAAGWMVPAVAQRRPCGRGDLPEELVPYYDEAEEAGSCLVFLQEGDGESAPADGSHSD
jgi:hypothetical protein